MKTSMKVVDALDNCSLELGVRSLWPTRRRNEKDFKKIEKTAISAVSKF